ncbi:putative Reverse transcriptase (RNA-dependent DNA polymerase) [Monocercomonoides exilis]|uniref:putative Reverse transcriptase (RNA-dependent DNA polymerase) n=1 Tax=Monocercomonoides exilis TaxID=2049356 RepID=UPI003559AE86|nr:putative Reverse transcriptase (RNA-dependent DNA polymerase) [Monocercomonoides exilis]|eukprot:MONOS_1651.1-p1 / transcript=MONOS_1651.1 / gene=MONOS_1651 / organism=Monocercomonoides_exilis_PA203 / gene_product=reverse transcriptase / transcript_product=reverse transcriptase / location=Mono_scaffold00030:125121-126026(+) / protein_length=301 / sequence_SO=supercontig / SO=protein_coding / is_pseudo=false
MSARERLEKENGRCRGFIGGKKEEQACAKWIQEGLRTEVLTKLTADQVGCLNNIFFIPKKNGKFRQIVDCRPLNAALKDVHFKMDVHRTVEKLLQKEDWTTSLDLSQAYYLIPVHREFSPFLAFHFRGDFFGFRGMPFGYKDATSVFTKVMRKVMIQERKRWRVRCVTYLDDILQLHQYRNYLRAATKVIEEWLGQLGLLVNMEKSKLQPKRHFDYLGWRWDSEQMTVRQEDQQRRKLRQQCVKWMKWVKRCKIVKVRDYASFIGPLSATRFVFRDASLFMNRWDAVLNRGVRDSGWYGEA